MAYRDIPPRAYEENVPRHNGEITRHSTTIRRKTHLKSYNLGQGLGLRFWLELGLGLGLLAFVKPLQVISGVS